TVQTLKLQDVVAKLHIKTDIKKLNAADAEKLQHMLQNYAKKSNSNMAIKDVQKKDESKAAPKGPKKKVEPANVSTQKEAPAADASKQPEKTSKNTTASDASSVSAYEKKVVELTNAERQKQGLKPLQIDEKLSKSA
nr:hypothetical protein [Bacillus pacificus]